MKTSRRVCLKSWGVTADNGDHFEVVRGRTYETYMDSAGELTVLSNFWVKVPTDCFLVEPSAILMSILDHNKNIASTVGKLEQAMELKKAELVAPCQYCEWNGRPYKTGLGCIDTQCSQNMYHAFKLKTTDEPYVTDGNHGGIVNDGENEK